MPLAMPAARSGEVRLLRWSSPWVGGTRPSARRTQLLDRKQACGRDRFDDDGERTGAVVAKATTAAVPTVPEGKRCRRRFGVFCYARE